MPLREESRSLCAGSLRQMTHCVGERVRGLELLFVILPDHFGATFVDLHVHHTARVDVGGQVDLRELHLGGGARKIYSLISDGMFYKSKVENVKFVINLYMRGVELLTH